ncbi:MAG: hypothetical protein GY841_08465 [FCB group bacterium]|nr:hypothetical protein [FCB group bacterium]
MKTVSVFSILFLFALALTAGLTALCADKAVAEEICAECFYDTYVEFCSTDTGKLCPAGVPRYLYQLGACTPGGNHNSSCSIHIGCCNDSGWKLYFAIPEPL